jgi:hypothetical protein
MSAALPRKLLDELTIDDERSYGHVAIYADLKEVVRRAGYSFRILPGAHAGRWDEALLLNLAFWDARSGGDVLVDERIDADVVTHAAWHWLSARAFATDGAAPSADALLFGEAVASAFDLYLVGRLLGHAPDAQFLESQVPAMAEVALAAGLSEGDFDVLLEEVAADPDRAFEDLRELLFDVSTELLAATAPDEAFAVLDRCAAHRFAPLLHRFELASWTLYARAYARGSALVPRDARVRELDAELRTAAEPVEWLARLWVHPLLAGELPPLPASRLRAR